MDYAALGGSSTSQEIMRYLNGLATLPAIEIHIFNQVLNEYLMDHGSSPLDPD